MELDLADFDLPQAIDDALMLMHERASRSGLTLDRVVDERLGEIRADERKVKPYARRPRVHEELQLCRANHEGSAVREMARVRACRNDEVLCAASLNGRVDYDHDSGDRTARCG